MPRWLWGWGLLASAFALGAPTLHTEGSYKSIVGFQRLRQTDLFPHQTQGVAEQRLRAQGSVTWDWLSLDVAHETSLWLKGANDPRVPLPSAPRAGLKGDWNVFDQSNSTLSHRLDRAFLQASFSDWEVTVGRQVLPGGVGQFFSAVSQIPRPDLVTVDPEYRIGRDGVLLAFKGDLRLEIAVLARGERQRAPDFHARLKTTLLGYDTAVVGGRSDDKTFAGLETAGNWGGSVLRGELAAYHDGVQLYWQGMAGWEKVLGPKWSTRAEFFYNGFGRTSAQGLPRGNHRYTPYLGSWYGAAGATWEISPRWKTTGTVVSNLRDPSVLAQLQVNCSFSSDIDFVVGQYVSLSRPPSGEFGGQSPLPGAPQYALGTPDLTYAELKMTW